MWPLTCYCVCVVARDLGRVRGGYLPPGAEKGWPANNGGKKLRKLQTQNGRRLTCLLDLVFSFCSGAEGPTAPHSGRLWGGVQAPDEPAGPSPLTATQRQPKCLRMSRWGRGLEIREEGEANGLREGPPSSLAGDPPLPGN